MAKKKRTGSARRQQAGLLLRDSMQVVFAIAAAIALSTTACSKQDAAPVQPAGTPVVAKPSTAAPDRGTTRVGTITPPPAAPAAKSNPPATGGLSAPVSGRPAGATGEPDPAATEPVPSAAAPVATVAPAVPTDSVIYYNFNGLTPYQIFDKKAGILKSGTTVSDVVASDIRSAGGEVLVYTGAGQDTLRDELYTKVAERAAAQTAEDREIDRAFAKSVQLASFHVDFANRRGYLSFTFERDGATATATLADHLDDQLRFQVGSFDKWPYLVAEAACMDLSGGCRSVHVRVQDSYYGGKIRTAQVLARHTNASFYVDGEPVGKTGNANYDQLMGILMNTVNKQSVNVLDKLTLTTSETIGAASGFQVTMNMRLQDSSGRMGADILQISGPLVRPTDKDDLNVALKVTPALTLINGEVTPIAYKRGVDIVNPIQLLRNDSRGNLLLQLNLPNEKAGAASNSITMLVSRIHAPTLPVRMDLSTASPR